MEPITNKLHSLVNEVVGYTDEDMILETCGSKECTLGNLVADAFMDLVRIFCSHEMACL